MTPVVRQATAQTVAYLRRSQEYRRPEDRDDGAGQRAEIAALAERQGVTIDRFYAGDWNISGQRGKRKKREDMTAILAGIRAGTISAVYAYSVDRLARDDAYGLDIRDTCEDAGVLVHTVAEGRRGEGCTFDFTDDRDRDYWGAEVTRAAQGGRRYTRVNTDTKAEARRHIWGAPTATPPRPACPKVGRPHKGKCDARCIPGEHCAEKHDLGGKLVYGSDPDHPGEDIDTVVKLWQRVGSFQGTARDLNAGYDHATRTWAPGSMQPRHGGIWTTRSVSIIIRRAGFALAPTYTRKGVSAQKTHIFSGLLTCRCGHTLTAMLRRGRKRLDGTVGPRSLAYYCRNGHMDPHHGMPAMVSEPKVLAWAIPEAEKASMKLGPSPEKVALVAGSLARLAAKRAVIVNLAADLTITPDDARKRLAKLDAVQKVDVDIQRAYELLGVIPGVDWSLPPAEVNATLRTIWREVILDDDMRPVWADWVNATLRGPDSDLPRDDAQDALDAERDRIVGESLDATDA